MKSINLGPVEKRGLYAIQAIKSDGYNFLAQFVVGPDRKAKWNQTARVTQALTDLFTSGIRNFEAKYDIGNIEGTDWFWAGVDVAIISAPLKLLRAGKLAAPAGRQLSVAERTRIFGPRLLPTGKLFKGLGRYGAVAATAYILVLHPSLITSLLSEIAELAGLNPLLVQIAGWSLIIVVALYICSWVLRPLTALITFILSWLEWSRKKSRRKIARDSSNPVTA